MILSRRSYLIRSKTATTEWTSLKRKEKVPIRTRLSLDSKLNGLLSVKAYNVDPRKKKKSKSLTLKKRSLMYKQSP